MHKMCVCVCQRRVHFPHHFFLTVMKRRAMILVPWDEITILLQEW